MNWLKILILALALVSCGGSTGGSSRADPVRADPVDPNGCGCCVTYDAETVTYTKENNCPVSDGDFGNGGVITRFFDVGLAECELYAASWYFVNECK